MSWNIVVSLCFFFLTSAERIPREMKWASDTYGPDGPWRAIEVLMGKDEKPTSLYPGSTWESWLIEESYCKNVDGTCYASDAGLFDKSGDEPTISLEADLSGFMLGLNLTGTNTGLRWMDNMRMNGVPVENASLSLLTDQEIGYRGGFKSPFFAGCLSLGGNGAINQSFGMHDNSPSINASLPPGWMYDRAWTPSNSFGMHIGSVQPSMSGSLWFGGYDDNRVVGEILTMNGSPRHGITLRDISIEVFSNTSTLSLEPVDDLLAKGNSSIGSGLKVLIDGCSPYLTLPKSTCDNIASNLPVNYDEDLGLYLWDTNSKDYKDLIPSATALTFSFISESNTDSVKIRVPFMHLNLTLSSPIVGRPTPYFPCHVNDKGQYVLGRAFLQDAFLGANWDADSNKWWLAQAPGRNIQATSNAIAIGPTDKTITKGGNDWEASWSGVWEGTKEAPSPNPTGDVEPEESGVASEVPEVKTKEEGMSIGVKAGIGAGAAFAAVALGVIAFLLWRRRKTRTSPEQTIDTTVVSQVNHDRQSYYKTPQQVWVPPQEMPVQEVLDKPSPYRRYELP